MHKLVIQCIGSRMSKQAWIITTVLIAGLLFAYKSNAQNGGQVIIKGTLTGDLKGFDKIYMYTRTSHDSAQIVNGQYTFRFPFGEAEMKMLYPEYVKEQHMMYQPFGILIAGPGTYYVTSDIKSGMNASTLKGPEPMLVYKKYQEDAAEANHKVFTLMNKIYGNGWFQKEESDAGYDAIMKSRDSLEQQYRMPLLETLLKKYPDSYASAFILSGSRELGSIPEKEAFYQMLSKKMQQTKEGKKYADYINGLKSSGVGNTVSTFVLPAPSGKPVDLADMRGKYVLIDFWASWCSPCRQSFPHMREVYKKYKGENFEIYSISIDEDKQAWLKGVKEENNPWPQSLDTKNISQKGFAVTAVPSTFLLDPNGKIMLKEVGFDSSGGGIIEQELKKLFGK